MGRQNFVCELVVRHILRHRIADPLAECGRAVVAEELPVDLHHVGPFVRPLLDVGIAADELVDEGFALVFRWLRIGEEGTNFVR